MIVYGKSLTTLLTNHIATTNFVNKGPEQLVREGFMR